MMIVIQDNTPVNCWVFREEECKYVVGEDYTIFHRYTQYLLDICRLEYVYGVEFRTRYNNAETLGDTIDDMIIGRIMQFEVDIFELNQNKDYGFVYCDMRYVE